MLVDSSTDEELQEARPLTVWSLMLWKVHSSECLISREVGARKEKMLTPPPDNIFTMVESIARKSERQHRAKDVLMHCT